MYEAPSTKKNPVELEDSVCAAASNVSIKQETKNVEVDEYIGVENDVTFE